MSKWLALNNYATFEMLVPGQITKEGVVVPERLTGEPRWGRTLHVGPGVPDYNAEVHQPEWPKPGQLAYIMNHGRHEIPVYNDEQVSYISAASVLDVLAVWDEEEKKLIPLGSNIEIKTVPPPDQMGGIYIPDTQRPISGVAEVVTVGRGWRGVNGKPIEFQVEAGQRVAFRSLEVMIVDLRPLGIDEDREIIMHGAVLAVLEDADAKEQAK